MENNNIEKLVTETKIGTCIKEINKVSGGLSHRMYKVVTDKGIYAIKELNSGVMKKKDAFSNFLFSEKVSEIAIQNKITAVGAMKINNEVITKIDNNYYMIFEWLDGRTLKANEIDCRINTINEKGLTLLLYKDARVDQNILDETVGSMNWQRKHTRDNANCIVSIWDNEKQQWIEKEDTGTDCRQPGEWKTDHLHTAFQSAGRYLLSGRNKRGGDFRTDQAGKGRQNHH